MLPTPLHQQAQDRWRAHVRLVDQALIDQERLWRRAQEAFDQGQARGDRPAPRPSRWRWVERLIGAWSDRAYDEQPTSRVNAQAQFLHDWRRTLDALPVWRDAGQHGVERTDPVLAESFWDRWRGEVVFVLDGLLDAHPQRRGNVMPFRGLRHALVSAGPLARAILGEHSSGR